MHAIAIKSSRSVDTTRGDSSRFIDSPLKYRRDQCRDRLLQEHAVLVLRFFGEDVAKDLDGVLDALLRVISQRRRHQ